MPYSQEPGYKLNDHWIKSLKELRNDEHDLNIFMHDQ